jgi:sulfur-carrier protein
VIELSIRVKVLYFAQVGDAAGTRAESQTLPEGASVAVLLNRVSQAHEKIDKMRRIVKTAVNEEMAGPDRVLRDGDTVALFPPITGG